MFAQTVKIDRTGRITLPKPALDALGAHGADEKEIVVELTDAGVVLKPAPTTTPITERIAAMNLPVADWEHMEREIETGRASG